MERLASVLLASAALMSASLVSAPVLSASLVWPAAVVAADCPRTTLGDVEDEVMCVSCGTPLVLQTDAPQANRERRFIRRRIAQCRTKDEVKSALAAEFGDEVLALPGDKGFDLAAYVVPGLALLLGAVAIGFAALRWRGRRRTTGNDGSSGVAERPPPAKDSERLDSDLKRYDL